MSRRPGPESSRTRESAASWRGICACCSHASANARTREPKPGSGGAVIASGLRRTPRRRRPAGAPRVICSISSGPPSRPWTSAGRQLPDGRPGRPQPGYRGSRGARLVPRGGGSPRPAASMRSRSERRTSSLRCPARVAGSKPFEIQSLTVAGLTRSSSAISARVSQGSSRRGSRFVVRSRRSRPNVI